MVGVEGVGIEPRVRTGHGKKGNHPMKWTVEAEEAVARVPFFVRKRVRKRLEALLRRKNLRDFWTLPMSETVHAKGMMGDGLDALRATLQRLLPRGAWSWRT